MPKLPVGLFHLIQRTTVTNTGFQSFLYPGIDNMVFCHECSNSPATFK